MAFTGLLEIGMNVMPAGDMLFVDTGAKNKKKKDKKVKKAKRSFKK